MTAHLRQGHFDRLLAVGHPAAVGSALFVHAERIVAFPERQAMARALRLAVAATRRPPHELMSGRVPIHRDHVAAAEATIDALALRLHAPIPVNARGMVRLRLVMSDGTGRSTNMAAATSTGDWVPPGRRFDMGTRLPLQVLTSAAQTTFSDHGWQALARCRGTSTDTFYPPDRARGKTRRLNERPSKQICDTCPVLDACRNYAVDAEELHGIWVSVPVEK